MLAYNQTLMDAAGQYRLVVQSVKRGLLAKERGLEISTAIGPRYQPRGLVYRIGMWVLTCIAANAAVGFLSLFFLNALMAESGYFLGPLVFAGVGAFLLNRKIENTQQAWRQGWDDFMALAIALCGCGAWCLFLFSSLHLADNGYVWCVALAGSAAICAVTSMFYADAFLSAVALCLGGSVPIALALQINVQMLFFAPAVYIPGNILFAAWAHKQAGRFTERARHHVWVTLRIGGLLMAFVFGNVYATTQAFNLIYPSAGMLPYYQVYFITTIGLPIVYLVRGLYVKDRPLMWTGIITLILARLSLLQMYPPANPALNAVVSGLVLTTLGLLVYRRLKHKSVSGYSLDEEEFPQVASLSQQVHTQAMGMQTAQPHEPGLKFGGGSFGGAGATGEF